MANPLQLQPQLQSLELTRERGVGVGVGTDKTAVQGGTGAPSFSDHLESFVHEVNALQKEAATRTEEFAEGRSNDIHGTMIALEQADVSLRLIGSVRNRLVDMYREVMRMGS